MRHLVVQRIALAVSALLVVASLLFAWRAGVTRAGGPQDGSSPPPDGSGRAAGEVLFGRHCAGCHAAVRFAGSLRDAGDRGAAAVAMLEFLQDHGTATAEEDRAIVGYLLSFEVESRPRARSSR